MTQLKNIPRKLKAEIEKHLKRGKSILLLGPRQVGKTTLTQEFHSDLRINLLDASVRLELEKHPEVLEPQLLRLVEKSKHKPLIILDEIQKIPILMDTVQKLIDENKANFILTGSSVRKLRSQSDTNWLPGRVVKFHLDPISLKELPDLELDHALFYGSLPGIIGTEEEPDKDLDLKSYVETYLEDEIRREAVTKNLGAFARFLELAGIEAGRVLNFTKISDDVGVSKNTIVSYFEVLFDTLVAERIEPISHSTSRKKLTKSPRFLFFDMGIRRICARASRTLGSEEQGQLFEQWIGLEILRCLRIHQPLASLRFWRDPDGPEVDWVIENQGTYIPIEVKWSRAPNGKDAKNLKIFLTEYKAKASQGFIISRTSAPYQLTPQITVLPWTALANGPFWK